MIIGGKEFTEEQQNAVLRRVFLEGHGPLALTVLLNRLFLLWEEVVPAPELVTKQNMGKQLLKMVGLVKEDMLHELTMRIIGGFPPAPLQEDKGK